MPCLGCLGRPCVIIEIYLNNDLITITALGYCHGIYTQSSHTLVFKLLCNAICRFRAVGWTISRPTGRGHPLWLASSVSTVIKRCPGVGLVYNTYPLGMCILPDYVNVNGYTYVVIFVRQVPNNCGMHRPSPARKLEGNLLRRGRLTDAISVMCNTLSKCI